MLPLACGSTSTQSVTGPSAEKCAVSLTAPEASLDAGGATGAVTVATQPECAWTAVAEAQWITNLSPTQGQGAGQVQFQIAQNPATTARQGAISVNGYRATIRQDATLCQFNVAYADSPIAAAGGSASIAVSAPSVCGWMAASTEGWLTLSPAAGTGDGTITVAVAQNTGEERSGTITVAGSSVTIVQRAATIGPGPTPTPSCPVTINPTSRSVAATASAGLSVAVAAATACQWTASSNAPWLTITSGSSGVGNGSVIFNAAANAGAARSGTLSIADKTFTVNQASGCTYVIAPTSQTAGPDGGPGVPIVVTTALTCPWTATANVNWLQITSGSAGTGAGIVLYQVAPYSGGGSSRTGTITIGNRTFTVTQARR